LARRSDWAEALQFSVIGLLAPALIAAGAPWAAIGLGAAAQELSEARQRRRERARSATWVGLGVAALVTWRTPAAVELVRSSAWALAAEAVILLSGGTLLWLECVASPPLAPRCVRPLRIAFCAVTMWAVWAMAYLVAMSNADWYPAYHHVRAHGLSVAVDQQVAAGVLWAAASACFLPVIFWNLMQWLRNEEDPDNELSRLVREDRRRALPPRPNL
jgi:cytochrome c oxidase assembly factor CtaG